MAEHTNRRRFIALAGSTAAVALAGCLDSGSDDETTDGSMDGDGMDGETTDTPGMGDGMTDTPGMGDGTTETDTTMSGPVTVTVRIENVAPTDYYGSMTSTGGAIWLTPGAYAIHTGHNPIYTEGEAASIGLEALAEAGLATGFEGEPGLVEELQGMEMGVQSAGAFTPEDTVADPNDPTGEVPGAPPIAPGGAFEFDVEVEQGQKLSFASMFVPSNDLFFAPEPDGIPLWPDDGEPVSGDVTEHVELWDAGTEPNAQPPGEGPDQAPAQERPNQGDDEMGSVRRVSELMDGYDYPAVEEAIQVTVTPHEMM